MYDSLSQTGVYPRLLLALLVIYGLSGCDDGGEPTTRADSGISSDMATSDATGRSDAANSSDQGILADAATTLDTGPPLDGSPPPDAEPPVDAEPPADAGIIDLDMGQLDVGLPDLGLPDQGMSDGSLNCIPPLSQLRHVTWPQVFENNCTQCHLPGGFAQQAGAGLIFHDPNHPERESEDDVHAYNLEQIIAYETNEAGESLLVAKALGELNHQGGERVAEGSPEHHALLRLYEVIAQGENPDCEEPGNTEVGLTRLTQRLELRTPQELFRSFTVQVLGRLPTAAEVIRIDMNGERPMLAPQPGPDEARREARDRLDSANLVAAENLQLRAVFVMIGEILRSPEGKAWLKDMWNEVFMFRGIYAQRLDRPYQVFNPHDFGARHWSDLCDNEAFLTDEDGNWIIGPDRQPVCNLEHEKFAFPTVRQPNASGGGYGGQAELAPEEACDFCRFTRHGIAEYMLYGAVEEPLELIAYTIQNERPLSEMLTSEDLMMNYYTSLVYFGTADPAANPFTADMDDVPLRQELKMGPNWVTFEAEMPDHRVFKPIDGMRRTIYAVRGRSYEVVRDGVLIEEEGQQREIGFRTELDPAVYTKLEAQEYDEFPRAGILTSAAFMARFPSNSFNMHRHRAWQVLRLLLDYDILDNQGERISLAEVEDPNGGATVTGQDCQGCHVQLDPVAGLFKDFHPDGHSQHPGVADSDWPGPREIHQPGWPSIDGAPAVPHSSEEPRRPPIRLLAEQIAAHPRFGTTMVKHAWQQVMGHPYEALITDPADPDFEARTQLVMARDRFFDNVITSFNASEQNMVRVYQRLFTSLWYRIKGLAPDDAGDIPDTVYAGFGRSGTLTPEEYFRRLEAIYGAPWPLERKLDNVNKSGTHEERLKQDFFARHRSFAENNNQFDLLFDLIDQNVSAFFGGIDFQNSLTRAELTNSIMTLVAQRIANEFACLVTYDDLQKPAAQRRYIPLDVLEEGRGAQMVNMGRVRLNIVHLFDLLLGMEVAPNTAEVDIAASLWADARASVLADVQASPVLGSVITPHCAAHGSERRNQAGIQRDMTGNVQAWMTVISYLLLQPEFLQR